MIKFSTLSLLYVISILMHLLAIHLFAGGNLVAGGLVTSFALALVVIPTIKGLLK